uniref:AP2/ERF and B3 domain-containing protein Os01g0141000-like n=1 Tax=Fragaria vesca subsp. vesca TaxID=101020 RepID=UPI0005C8AC0C|nr:PREDICTED: AP2/ERF and B3 domain-containing protein Os01g0141000-like [Fragaria vesca subsp. vesca]
MPLLYNRQQPFVFHHIHLCPFVILSSFQFPVVFQTSFPMSIDLSSDSTIEMVVQDRNLPVTSPSHQNRRAGRSQQGSSSSKLKGLVPLKGGKWGARISYNYKRYSLGTHETEIEAAIAYDRAALKIPRAHSLNFHRSNYTIEESTFQSQHSIEDILKIFMKEQGIVYECVLQKELTLMDVTHKCFLVQGDYASLHFPTKEHECLNSTATLWDIHGLSWTFGCSYWHITQSFFRIVAGETFSRSIT